MMEMGSCLGRWRGVSGEAQVRVFVQQQGCRHWVGHSHVGAGNGADQRSGVLHPGARVPIPHDLRKDDEGRGSRAQAGGDIAPSSLGGALRPRQDRGEEGLAAGVHGGQHGHGGRLALVRQRELLAVGLRGEVQGHLATLRWRGHLSLQLWR